MRYLIFIYCILVCTVSFATGNLLTQATTQGAGNTAAYPGYIEGGMNYNKLTNNFGTWVGEYGIISKKIDAKNTWLGNIDHKREFGENGTILGATNYHDFTDAWYTTVSLNISDKSFFLQRYSGALTLYHKMLKAKQLVPYFGVIKYIWRTHHQDTVLNPGFIYYFEKPWVVEAGLLLQRSDPGNVDTLYKYIAITQGEEKKHYYTARLGWGREGYLAVSSVDITQNFPSYVVTLTWRQWLTENWGFNLVGEGYKSRVYHRAGVQLGVFRDI
jgi:YaiO family outer membrane protein